MSIAPGLDAAPAVVTNTPPTLDDFFEQEAEQAPAEDADLSALIADDELPPEGEEAEGAIPEIEEEQEEEAPAAEAAPPPSSWSKEDLKAWEALSPEAQAVVTRREAERDKYVRKVGFEASQTRQQVENQAREVIAKQHQDHAVALSIYAQQFQAQPPDQRLLYTGNQDDVLTYQRQDAAYRASAAQQQELQQAIAAAQAQADSYRSQAQQADIASDAQRLREQLPEWFDPSAGPDLHKSLQEVGSELGYTAELMAAASSTDILALKKAASWKADAEKYRALQKKKMEVVRAAKDLPRMARPGVRPTRGQQEASTSNRRADALQSFGHTRSGEDAAALLLERKR